MNYSAAASSAFSSTFGITCMQKQFIGYNVTLNTIQSDIISGKFELIINKPLL